MPGHLNQDEFLTRLGSLFDSRRNASHGSVHLTQKRLSPNNAPSTTADSQGGFTDLLVNSPLPILIRATDGRTNVPAEQGSAAGKGPRYIKNKEKLKLSTVVQSDELANFYARYAEICKAGMSGLKKRDRSGRKKADKKRKQQKGKKGGNTGQAK